MFKITIPKPCHEDWALMTTAEQGRHCNVCAKTVTDFTGMSDEEIQLFFLNRTSEKICGRFKNDQLQRICIKIPEKIFYLPMPLWKKFLVASLVAFSTILFSCDTKIEKENKTTPENITPNIPGGISTQDTLPVIDSIVTCNTATAGFIKPIIIKDSYLITGDIAIEPLEPPKIDTITQGEISPAQVKKEDSLNCEDRKYY